MIKLAFNSYQNFGLKKLINIGRLIVR
jgi:hypothetical protein